MDDVAVVKELYGLAQLEAIVPEILLTDVLLPGTLFF